MKIILALCFLFFQNNILYSQKPFDYKAERLKFNLSLIKGNKKNRVISKRISDDEKFEGKYLGKIKTRLGVEYYILSSS